MYSKLKSALVFLKHHFKDAPDDLLINISDCKKIFHLGNLHLTICLSKYLMISKNLPAGKSICYAQGFCWLGKLSPDTIHNIEQKIALIKQQSLHK